MLTALKCVKGDVAGNLARHRDLAKTAGDDGCDLVLLPEMSLTGYRPSACVALDHPAVTELVAATSEGTALCFGLVEADRDGGRPFITQVIADHGQIVAVHRKSHLGDGEDTDFQPGTAAEAFRLADARCSVAVCAEIGSTRPYSRRGRSDRMGACGAGVVRRPPPDRRRLAARLGLVAGQCDRRCRSVASSRSGVGRLHPSGGHRRRGLPWLGGGPGTGRLRCCRIARLARGHAHRRSLTSCRAPGRVVVLTRRPH